MARSSPQCSSQLPLACRSRRRRRQTVGGRHAATTTAPWKWLWGDHPDPSFPETRRRCCWSLCSPPNSQRLSSRTGPASRSGKTAVVVVRTAVCKQTRFDTRGSTRGVEGEGLGDAARTKFKTKVMLLNPACIRLLARGGAVLSMSLAGRQADSISSALR